MSPPAPAGVYGVLRSRAEDLSPGSVDVWDELEARVDLAELRPKLRDDIEIKVFRSRWGNDSLMIANPRDLLHYRLPATDLELLETLDGSRTLKQIVVERFEESGELELSAAIALVRTLYEGNFLEETYVDVGSMVVRALDPATDRRRTARQFARTLSIEWKNADRLVRWLYEHGLKVMFRRWAAAICLAITVVGLVLFVELVGDQRFKIAGKSLAVGFVVLLVLDYVMVFCHELGHALVVIHNGRRIRSAGFQIYFGSPAFFVDSSDGMMMERRQQILESFAGPFAQLVLAGISSTIAWAYPGWALSETLYKFAVLNYLVVIMNLIPLLELDGYYILADAIEIPDLRERSLAFLRSDLLHKVRTRERLSRRELGLLLYGVLGIVFSIVSFYTAYFYWRTVFGGLVGRLWEAGPVPRLLLIILGVFVMGPLVRGLIKLARSVGRRFRAVWRRIRFRLETRWRVEAAEMIDALPTFEDVPVEALNELAGRFRLRTFASGQPVFRQGDSPESFYVVRRGRFEVVEEDPDTGVERTIRALGRGESFGELALVTGAPRTATVRAAEESELFEVDKGAFDRLLADSVRLPDFAPTLQELVELRRQTCFAGLGMDQLAELRVRGEWIAVAPGETIIQEGELGDAFYAISSGQVDVMHGGNVVATLGPGSYFGEVALLMDVPRTATVVARTPVRAFRLDREGFDRLVSGAFRRGTLTTSAAATDMPTH